MIKRLVGELPVWMRPGHPVLRYTLERRSLPETRSARYTRFLFLIFSIGVLFLVGLANASNFFEENPLDLPFSLLVSELLFWPIFILQVGVQLTVLLTTISTIGEERRRRVWDNLRMTSAGTALTLRTSWSATVFFRLRGVFSLLLAVRLVLIGALLFDLTAFQGEYLQNLTGSITPQVSVPVSVLLVALLMTASLLLPITATGFDAAFGLLLSTLVKQRIYIVMTQVLLIAIRIAMLAGLVVFVEQFRLDGAAIGLSDGLIWVLLLSFAAIGDWGLSFLYLGFFGAQIWIDVPYGILLGAAMMGVVLVQAILADGMLAWAIRRAERME